MPTEPRENGRRIALQGARFLASGAANTLATLAIYWLLLRVTGYQAAYTVSYLAGIAIAYLANSLFVFRTRPKIATALRFPSVYIVQYLLGLAILWAWTGLLGLPATWGVLATTAVTLPVTFFISRRIFSSKQEGP